MEQTRKFPGFGYALLLMLAALVLMVGLIIPVAVVDFLFKMKLVEHPGVMSCISLVSSGTVIFVGALITKAPFREVFPMKPVRPALALPVILSVLARSSCCPKRTIGCDTRCRCRDGSRKFLST